MVKFENLRFFYNLLVHFPVMDIQYVTFTTDSSFY